MSNVKYSDLIRDVLPHLTNGPSDPLVEAAIRNAVIEFCNQSWLWRYLPDPIDIVAGEVAYDLEPTTGADVAAVLSCSIGGNLISPASTDDLDRIYTGWQSLSGPARHYTQTDTNSILLVPRPEFNIAGALVMVLALQPRRSSTAFPGWIADQYAESLAAGALSRLLLMPGKAWSDGQAGMLNKDKFQAAIQVAKAFGTSGLSRAPVRTTAQH
ncbi:hypothetical protein [Herminiimonas sp. CN]|uniref:phage adaptor protein n=1 Tax=Herminiimonas sp. CN TaxID=1349818 RepID=UPI00047327DF|nr:hypothetical protein [Herminiimonas sp. CN]